MKRIIVIKDTFINIDEIASELKNMQKILDDFDVKFSILNQTITYIFDKIKTCKTPQEIQYYFDALDKIQTGLACLLFKYGMKLPSRLERFTRDFDNLEMYQDYYLEKIKSGEYSF